MQIHSAYDHKVMADKRLQPKPLKRVGKTDKSQSHKVKLCKCKKY